MKKNASARTAILAALLMIVGTITILSLLFPVFKVDVLGVKYEENGFQQLDFKSDFLLNVIFSQNQSLGSGVIIGLGVVSILGLVVGLISVITAMLGFAFGKNGGIMKYRIGLCFFYSVIYLLSGIALKEIAKNVNGEAAISAIGWQFETYLPIIVMAVVVVIGFIALAFFQSDDKIEEEPQENAVEELSKLKDLLDRGIITQEVFDEKSKKYIEKI